MNRALWIGFLLARPDDSSSSVEWEEVLSIAPALNIFVFFNAILILGLSPKWWWMLESPELIVFKVLNKPLQSRQQLFLNALQPEKRLEQKSKT